MFRRAAVALALPFALAPLQAALAQTTLPVRKPSRLGDFLVEHADALAGQYDAALAWYAHSQLARQQQARSILLQNIAALANFDRQHARRYVGLFHLVQSLQATGRVVLPQTDPRYLQAHPRITPILAAGDQVLIPARPTTVTVVRSDGKLCPVHFSPGVDALVYLRACDRGASPEHVWVIQPTGRIQHNGSGIWNAQAQDPPAPGAWIWAPDPDSGWPARISGQLAQFLATQPPFEPPKQLAATQMAQAAMPPGAATPAAPASAPAVPRTAQAPVQVAVAAPARAATAGAQPATPHYAPPAPAGADQASGSPSGAHTQPPKPDIVAARPAGKSAPAEARAMAAPAPAAPASGPGTGNWSIARALRPHGMAPAVAATRSLSPQALAQAPERGLQITSNDWGEPGLLQMPSARMDPTGTALASISHAYPYTRMNFMFQPLSWLEFGFRYTDILNQLYGPSSLSGNQSYKDKSADVKIRLQQETRYLPELALGLQDFAGTGLFSSEYLVGSKRLGPFDLSAGITWGYLAGRRNLKNPFSLLSKGFDTRVDSTTGSGGSFSFRSYFHGRSSVFAGLQYQTPVPGLVLKAEYDANNYQHEPFGAVLPVKSPFNVGAVYRVNRNVDIGIGYERGNTLQAELTLHGNLADLNQPKLGYPAPEPLQSAYARQAVASRTLQVAPQNDASVVRAILDGQGASDTPGWPGELAQRIEQQCLCHVAALRQLPSGDKLYVGIDNPGAYDLHPLLSRIERELVLHAPDRYRHFVIVFTRWGAPEQSVEVDRQMWLVNHTQYLPPQARIPDSMRVPPPTPEDLDASTPLLLQTASRFHGSFGPGYQQTLGGPNAFILYQLSANGFATYDLGDNTWLAGDINYGLLNNYSKFTYTAPSNLPRVRTNIREYVTTSRLTMPLLQITHVGQLSDNTYYSLYGGALEAMFAGVGGEVLYRPWGSSVALGADLNYVRQRGFSQKFTLLPYHVVTGHATLYWKTGIDGVLAKLGAGRYLAGDKGVTVDLSRTFANGVRIGAYATKTNISAATFGEGSFNKGIYLDIPFDLMLTRSSEQVAHLLWQPLLRDGGAMLDRRYKLYELTSHGFSSNMPQ